MCNCDKGDRDRNKRSTSIIPECGGVWAGEISAGVTDDASSEMRGTMSPSETGSDSADTTCVSGTAELWAESEVSSAAADSGHGAVAA